jgi:FKBP-type peptidyl-prolyl cis-trans isomerase
MPISKLMRSGLMLAVVATAACLDSGAPDEKRIEETSFAATLGVDIAASTKTENGAYFRDITAGTGPSITSGKLTIRYTGWLSNGTQFDSNVTKPDPLAFSFGGHEVIPGFEEALLGVKVGATRQLIVPPSLGYGLYDYGPIPGNSVLVFKVEVVSAQ